VPSQNADKSARSRWTYTGSQVGKLSNWIAEFHCEFHCSEDFDPITLSAQRYDFASLYWSEWQDFNLRPPRPERGALPDRTPIPAAQDPADVPLTASGELQLSEYFDPFLAPKKLQLGLK
jgi:hypothetical protein